MSPSGLASRQLKILLYRYLQTFQHPDRFIHIASLNCRNNIGRAIYGITQVKMEILSIDAFCNLAKNTSCHSTTRGDTFVDLNRNNAAVARLLRREVATEADQVIAHAALVACRSLRDLCRAGLSRYVELVAACRLGQSVADDVAQDGTYLLQSAIRTDLLIDNLNREFFHCIAVLHSLSNEAGTNHLSVVSDGVVEGQDVDGRQLHLVADAHPGQGGLGKVFLLGSLDVGYALAWDLQVERLVDTHALQAIHKLLRIVLVVLVDDAGHSDVGRHLHDAVHVDGAITSTMPVVVAHGLAVHHLDAVASINDVVGRDFTVLQRHHDGGGLEGGTRLLQVADGEVAHLVIVAILSARHVDNSLHVACGYIHQDGYARHSFQLFQLVDQRLFTDILHVDVDSGDDIATIHGRTIHDVQVLVHHLLTVGDAFATFQQGVESQLDAILRTLSGIGIHVAQRTCSE